MIEVERSVGALGVVYSSAPFWRKHMKNDGRPLLKIDIWFWKIFIYLPFDHYTRKGHGTATSDYGVFWWPALRKRPQFHWRTI